MLSTTAGGKEVLRVVSMPAAPSWAMRRELMSQSYTTKVNELWTVRARERRRKKHLRFNSAVVNDGFWPVADTRTMDEYGYKGLRCDVV